ncbi:YraN family protein [Rothia sp. CCM 9417]|uniref:YraN family protein n=1 Tax=unclassified Rothia (in: high G+C Gram-positive bacteria) TaxID=2689056 RepID=UPI003AC84F7B
MSLRTQSSIANHTRVGRWGEDLALLVLELNGYSLVERNWRPPSGNLGSSPVGEIDLVMVDPDMDLVFIEVKTRSGSGYGHPLEAITREKGNRLRQLAYAWCSEHTGDYRSLRIDAVAVCGTAEDFTFEHVKAVL